jgi:hypothetical protein
MFKYFLICITFISFSIYAQTTALIIPAGPGGLYHKYASEFTLVLSSILKRNVILEFHPGAQGLVGAQILADNKKSDISLMFGTVQPEFFIGQQQNIIPLLYLGIAPTALVASNKLDARNIKELVSSKRKLNVGIAHGSSQLLWIRKLVEQNPNLDINEIPYKSGNGVLVDVANGNLDLGIASVVGAESLIQAGKVKALAVLSNRRSTLLPQVPTAFEQGIPFDTGFAHLFLWASPGVSPDKISAIQREFALWAQTKEAQHIFEKIDLGFDLKNATQPLSMINKILKK